MKIEKIITLVLFVVLFTSCKNENKADSKTEKKENFNIEVEITTNKNDNFPLYYTEDGTINFSGTNAVWKGVKGQPEKQTITLDLPNEIMPTHIRIDFGIIKGEEQADITLHKFKMNYNGKSFETNGSNFLRYFIKNDSVKTEIDVAKGTITFKKNPGSKIDRFYYPQQTIVDEITKITK